MAYFLCCPIFTLMNVKHMLYIADSILHDVHLAEDAVSEAFIKIINNLDKINPKDCYWTRGFVVIIVRNVALDMLRKQKKSKETMIDFDDSISYEDLNFDNITAEEACQKIIKYSPKDRHSYNRTFCSIIDNTS